MSDQPIHVVHLFRGDPRNEADVVQLVRRCGRILRDAPRPAFHFTLVMLRRRRQETRRIRAEARRFGVELRELVQYGRFDVTLPMRLGLVLGRQGVDVLHAYDATGHLLGLALQPLFRFRLVATARAASKGLSSAVLTGTLQRQLLPGFDRVIAANNQLAQQLCRLGCRPAKVDVIHHSVDTEFYARGPRIEDYRRAVSIPRDARVIGVTTDCPDEAMLRQVLLAVSEVHCPATKIHVVLNCPSTCPGTDPADVRPAAAKADRAKIAGLMKRAEDGDLAPVERESPADRPHEAHKPADRDRSHTTDPAATADSVSFTRPRDVSTIGQDETAREAISRHEIVLDEMAREMSATRDAMLRDTTTQDTTTRDAAPQDTATRDTALEDATLQSVSQPAAQQQDTRKSRIDGPSRHDPAQHITAVLKDARGETPSRQDATTSGDAQAMAEAISETHAMLRRLAEEFEMPGQLRLIPGRMTPSQYAACDLFVVMDDQSVSLDALLEAQSMEVPVIATDETLTAEMIEDGTTGRLVDFDDVAAVSSALNGLLDDTRAARAMAIAGRLRVCQQFDENERDQRVARCYQRVMAEA